MKQLILLVSIFGFTLSVNAQQEICYGSTHTYTVDTADGPTGTSGSTYAWSVATAGFAGTITPSANSASIDWATTSVGTYTLEVTESNNGCIGDIVFLTINVKPVLTVPNIAVVNATICHLDTAMFEITGGSNQTVTYNINGGADQTVTLDAQGEATVSLTNVTGNQTITITSITSTAGCSLSNITVSETVNVNAPVVTSPIGF
jgi:hypothetical protein